MVHLPDLILDLSLILIAAGTVTLICRKLKQPAVLGYIVAGFLLSPTMHWLPNITESESIKVWAEIGVIFLLFGLGLEFSFKKLARVGGAASITAVFEVVGMLAIGYLCGQIFGWTSMDSLFLGGILAISSTTIIIRAFDELGVKTRGFVSLVFGVLIVEDLVAILLMVLLTTMAVTQTVSGGALAVATLKLGFFLALWFLSGIFIIPTFLKRTRKLLTNETMLVVSLGLCFLMVVLAARAGFSPALGAFIMGSVLSETAEGERIEHLIHPVKDLFAAIFFVSVGMMIDPAVLAQYWEIILILTAVTILGKGLTTCAGALISGRSLRHAIQSGMSLAQIGEFSFIIASLGLSLKVTSEFLYPIAIGVSALTTFTTPYLIRSADGVVGLIERRAPAGWLQALESFRTESRRVSHTSEWRITMRKFLVRAAANTVMIVAIFLIVKFYLMPWLSERFEREPITRAVGLTVALCFSSPFLWAMAFRPLMLPGSSTAPERAVNVARWITATVLLAVMSSQMVSPGMALTVACVLILVVLFILSRFLGGIYSRLEERFIDNLQDKERSGKRLSALAPWDAHLVELKISADSPLIGQPLARAMIRERFGVTIALIERGSKVIAAPGRDDTLYPYDVLHVIGTDEQIAKLREECEMLLPARQDVLTVNYALVPVVVKDTSEIAGKTIRDCGLRESLRGLVVGIERAGQRILNPDSGARIEAGDLLWVVADRHRAQELT